MPCDCTPGLGPRALAVGTRVCCHVQDFMEEDLWELTSALLWALPLRLLRLLLVIWALWLS